MGMDYTVPTLQVRRMSPGRATDGPKSHSCYLLEAGLDPSSRAPKAEPFPSIAPGPGAGDVCAHKSRPEDCLLWGLEVCHEGQGDAS